ncbi:MAG: asparagine synthase, partial [Brevundimonas sp.]
AALQDPLASAGPLLLDGPTAVLPGAIQPIPLETPPTLIWRPADIARASLGVPPSPEDAARGLAAALDETVSALAGLSGPLAAEVSGGLDSSVVAACLVKREPHDVALWLNAVGATPEADERPYVDALAAHLGITPLSVPHATAPTTPADLEDAAGDFRPGLNGLDRPHDADWARRCRVAGIIGLMTGKGGDSILLQRATAEVFIDLWRERGWRALRAPDVLELARANEISIWTLVAKARRFDQQGYPPLLRDHPLLPPVQQPPKPHPWVEDLDAFGPAKALQIAGVADSVSRHGSSLLTRVVDVRHPLCAQPVIEACLSLPTSVLTTGGRDRGLARLAFRGRLPPAILDRRSKGDMTSIYGRRALGNLAVLRPWLMKGRLAALGLIDPAAIDRELTRETLLWRGRYGTLSVIAAYEAWVRVWERRLGSTT